MDAMSTPKALTLDEAERVRARLVELRSRHRNASELARRLGIGQQHVSSVLGGRMQPGIGFARKVASAIGVSLDELLGGAAVDRRLRALPGWDDAAREAKADRPELAALIDRVGELVAPEPPERPVSARDVIDLAHVWSQIWRSGK